MPRPEELAHQPRERTGPWIRGPFQSIQVNVDANGADIPGDAANEPSMAIDPTDPSRIVIGWRQFDTIISNFRQAGWAYSHDAGQTWTFPGVINPGVFRSDPVLAADTQGNFFYNSLTLDAQSNFLCDVYKSADGGVSWGPEVDAFGGDKQWMVIDHTSAIGRDNIYAFWTRYWSMCNGSFTRSYDGGQSFVDCTDLPGSPYWGTMTVGPDGELYIAGDGFTVIKSSTIKDQTLPVAFDFATTVDLDGSMGFSGGPNPAGLLGQAWIATDHSGGPNRGNVYLLCSVNRNSTTDPLDVMFARSTDGGLTWSDPVRVNDDPEDNGAYQWFGTMSVAPNGRIDAIWNDTRRSPWTIFSEVYYSYSTDAGRTWTRNVPVSPLYAHGAGYPNQDKLGDYYHMISDDDGAGLAYAATFNGGQDVYYLRLFPDCNENGINDATDLTGGTSNDCGGNGMPDECEPDCNGNGAADSCDIFTGTSGDCNANRIPDECERNRDCNYNGVQDICDVAAGTSPDCNGDAVPDECSLDCDGNNVPDVCEPPVSTTLLLGNESSQAGVIVGPQGAPLAQDIHLDGPATLRRLAVGYRAVGSTSSAVMTVRFFNGSADDAVLPEYPAGLIGELVRPDLVNWSAAPQIWSYVLPEPISVPANTWVEVDFDFAPGQTGFGLGMYGLIHLAGPHLTGFTHGLVYDRENATTTTGPLYLDITLSGVLCADCNSNGSFDVCDLDCNWPGEYCDVPGCGQSPDCNGNGNPDDCDPDADGDGAPDDCDACPNEPALAAPDEPAGEVTCTDTIDNDCDGLTDMADQDCVSAGCPYACADLDVSGGIIDLNDFAVLANCFALSAPTAECGQTELLCSDVDASGTVDLNDFATFAVLFATTPSTTVPNCIP